MIERYSLPRMSAVWQDESKFRKMLDIEILAVEAFAKSKKVPASAAERIRKKANFNIEKIKKIEEKTQHDVVAFVTNVAQYIVQDARYLHMGLTSSDVLDTTLALQMREAADIILEDIAEAMRVVKEKAKKYKDMACIGRTHGVHAEPVTFGLKLALWYDELRRNAERMHQAREAISYGKISGAVGTYVHVEPGEEAYICKKLGLKPVNIATQVIQRDGHAQFLTALAIVGGSLEKFATEIRHLQRTEVLEAEEPFGKNQKGSSAMPHKRNPVICERICGLARILRANALAGMEDIALWHERDISHSSVERVILPDSTIALDYMLHKFIEVVKGMTVHPENMLANLARTKGLIFSQRVLLALMNRGFGRTEAYDIVQRAAMKTWKSEAQFRDALLEEEAVRRVLGEKELDTLFDLDYYLKNVNAIYKKVGI